MSGTAIIMMVIAMVTVWGGLALSVVHLLRHPDETSGELAEERTGARLGGDPADVQRG